MPARRRRTILLGLLTFALAAAAPAATAVAPDPATAGETDATDPTPRVTWSIVPATTDGADGRVSFRHEVDPGGEVTDHVEVTNYSDRTITFALTASDGIVSEEGVFDLLPSSETPIDAGAWIDVPAEVELEPLAAAVVPFTLTVPDDALPGDHPAGIVASVRSVADDGTGSAVSLDTRVGARLHLRVHGDVVPAVDLQDLRAEYVPSWNPFAPGTVQLRWSVANVGNVRLGATQTAEVSGPFGLLSTERAVANQREVLPRQSAVAQASFETWPLFVLDLDVGSAQVVVGDDQLGLAPPRADAHTRLVAVPWPQLIVLMLVGGLVTGAVVRRRRRATAG